MVCGECPNRACDGGGGIELMTDFSAPSYPEGHRCHVKRWRRPRSDGRGWRSWTPEEDEFIRRFRKRYGDRYVAERLERTVQAVGRRARRIGVTW